MFDSVLLANERLSFKLTWSIYRFGTLGYVALIKQAKFDDQRDFSLSSGFSDEWNRYGRYHDDSKPAHACSVENTPGGFGKLEAVDGLCDSRPPQAAICLFCTFGGNGYNISSIAI